MNTMSRALNMPLEETSRIAAYAYARDIPQMSP